MDLLRRGSAGPEIVHLDRRPVPRGRLVARRRGAFFARDAVVLLRLFGVLADFVLGIILGFVIIGEKRGRDARRDAERHERQQAPNPEDEPDKE